MTWRDVLLLVAISALLSAVITVCIKVVIENMTAEIGAAASTASSINHACPLSVSPNLVRLQRSALRFSAEVLPRFETSSYSTT
jgi:hypothetical protein